MDWWQLTGWECRLTTSRHLAICVNLECVLKLDAISALYTILALLNLKALPRLVFKVVFP
eukprot:1078202-Pleurochrysis_carterae.AAC.5